MSDSSRNIDRRTFLKRGLTAGGLLAGGALAAELARAGHASAPAAPFPPGAAPLPPRAAPGPPPREHEQPNILVVLVDQLRSPSWLAATSLEHGLLPNLSRLRREAVSFERHYTASNDCTPARSALLTGLYTHQTGCLITGGSTLDAGFPTWGTMLREHGYRTYWYGKWHLTHGDNNWSDPTNAGALEPYGFAGGTYPSPDGGPGQGWRVDPQIIGQFEKWFARQGSHGPWCTTVSLVNPHDIAWWYQWSNRVPAERDAPSVVDRLPGNFETPEQLMQAGKPRLQRSLQDTAARSFGPVPFSGPSVRPTWLPFLDLYVKLQREVDAHLGRILRTLESRPEVAANTVVVFTSDHGEYGASHGLRGKGAGVYEEAIRVPLIVKDPRGVLARASARARTQLTSSVDVAPLLLSLASGSGDWRGDSHYSQLAGRLDLAAILANPAAAGRTHALHATDEIVTEFATEPYAADAPLHVAALLTGQAKYATYTNWSAASLEPQARGRETELYDYRTRRGRLELHNAAGQSALEEALHTRLQAAYREELRQPLPQRLRAAQHRGYVNYRTVAAHAARASTLGHMQQFTHLGATPAHHRGLHH
jgi:arylsulfatase A-like enzyme